MTRKHIFRLLAVSAVAATTLLAQRQRPFAGGDNQEGPMGPRDPAAMAERRIAFMTTLLNLTDAQTTQATTIFTNAANAAAPLQANLFEARQEMREAVKTNNAGAIDQLSATIGNLTGQTTAIHNKAEAAFYALLTAEQRTKFDSFGRGGPGMPGGPGGGFGPRGGRGPQ